MPGSEHCGEPSSGQQLADVGGLTSVGPDSERTGCFHCEVEECSPCGYTSIPAATEQGADFTFPTHPEPVFGSGSWLPWPVSGPNAPPPESHI